MNIQKIEIDNYGCIDHFEYQFRKNVKGFPVPLILIGRNGSGKTLALANIVDAMVEIKRQSFGSILEVTDNKYFKIGSKSYIKKGADYSRVAVTLMHNSSTLAMYDIMSNKPQQHIDQSAFDKDEIANTSQFVETGFSKKVSGTLKKNEYNNFIQLYFPADRYYSPLWYNSSNYQKISYSATTEINCPQTNIIKIDLLSNVKEWLTDVWMSSTVQLLTTGDDENLPAHLRGQTLQIVQYTQLQSIINSLFSIIKGQPCQPQRPNRKNKYIGISTQISNCYDISQLSAGEMYLYAIGLSILKEWDLNHEINSTDEIMGTVVIDEAEENLHIDFMYNSLPKLMRLFPNVQFILTAHSPFLLAGLKKEYEDDVDIIDMPNGDSVSNIDEFSEMLRAFELFDQEAELVSKRNKQLSDAYSKMQTLTNRIFVVTEGKTDVKHIQNAFSRLYNSDDEIIKRIQYFDFAQTDTLGDELHKALKYWSTAPNVCKIIAIFDRDKKIFSTNDDPFEHLGNNVYICNLPQLENEERKKDDKISIEHYYTNAELLIDTGKGHLYQWGDFDKFGTSYDGCWSIKDYAKNTNNNALRIVDKNLRGLERKSDAAQIISKDEFANYVAEHPDCFDVANFAKIYDLIKRISEE